MMANCAMEATHPMIYMDVFACFTKCQGFFSLPPLPNNWVQYSWKWLAVAQYSSILFQVPSNFICVALIHQKLPALKSPLSQFVLLLSTLQFPPFVRPVKPPWLTNIMLRVPHTAGFSGSCPVSENLTYGHSSRGVAGTKVLFILPGPPPPRLPQGPQMVWGVKLATLQSQPPPSNRPAGHSCPPSPLVISSIPWSTLQMLKCDNRKMQVCQRHWGRVCRLTTAGVCLLFTSHTEKRQAFP